MLEYNLYGNHQVWHKLVNDSLTGRLAHAYLFSGPKGIGKASIAKNFIKLLLGADQNLAKRIDQNNYLDLLIIDKQDKNEIGVDKVRNALNFLGQTPHEGDKKFLIIDSTDDLNSNSANALLKVLEEPRPNTYIFLIAHSFGRVLATIKSRTRIIKFSPLSKQDLKLIVKNENYLSLFEDFIAGSAVKALELDRNELGALYLKLLDFIETSNISSLNKLLETNLKSNWESISELVTFIISRCIKIKAKCGSKIDPIEDQILTNIANSKALETWFKIFDLWRKSIEETEIYNLDKKQILILTLENIRNKEVLI